MIFGYFFEKQCFNKRLPIGKLLLPVCLTIILLSTLFVFYLCPENGCAISALTVSQYSRYRTLSKFASFKRLSTNSNQNQANLTPNPTLAERSKKLSFEDVLSDNSSVFDIKANDVIVFLHIQKTGGTSFGRHLVKDLNLVNPCECKKGRKRCKCLRPDSNAKLWLFSRYTTGWKCGLHADWTELTNCVDSVMDESEKTVTKRRYFYITLLREPVARFLSEFRHVQRGATWKSSRHWCGGRTPTSKELPPCYTGIDWRDVTLEEFINCSHNLAVNRQTRMLADLTLVDCYNTSIKARKLRDSILLQSAKYNLNKMAFFGCSEYQKISQYLFESTFKLHFMHPFIQLNETHSSLMRDEIDENLLEKIKKINHLDIQFYEFAKQLLFERFKLMKSRDSNFEYNFSHLGNLGPNEERLLSQQNLETFPEFRILKKIERQKKKLKALKQKKNRSTLYQNKSNIEPAV
ncbi:heparan-sulfate 6-O-sulfotransferase 2-like protein [Dinothrombium tinctorium]|uniref:Heparan-sulfate 6-O-sulfotransferase n=1 Tax=Dinothrombium tinctorium TaxID=1965070 RepID=A0A3S3PQM1_9ACAR|nr:heparan-sulfate 6-O-sulfotransferase 2-like protein [Dinothrombium tinctorium]